MLGGGFVGFAGHSWTQEDGCVDGCLYLWICTAEAPSVTERTMDSWGKRKGRRMRGSKARKGEAGGSEGVAARSMRTEMRGGEEKEQRCERATTQPGFARDNEETGTATQRDGRAHHTNTHTGRKPKVSSDRRSRRSSRRRRRPSPWDLRRGGHGGRRGSPRKEHSRPRLSWPFTIGATLRERDADDGRRNQGAASTGVGRARHAAC